MVKSWIQLESPRDISWTFPSKPLSDYTVALISTGGIALKTDRPFHQGGIKLKAQPGKNITVGGSPTLVRSLLQDGLLDKLTLMIHPVILGKGKRLFTEDLDLKRLQLVDSKVTSTGIVILTYQPATDENEQ